ncbi:MAG: acyl-CoA desaturase [Mucilaginibacter sp.]|jgi:stearoyl-CoA desaturase (delta-9 desaturase)|nr:acyl-CoA desaturase [Mucilaginibacter sp.]
MTCDPAPYNAQAAFFYCFLADVNHRPIARDLSELDYNRIKLLMKHTGIGADTYAQYQKWGSYVNPYRTIMAWLLNWSFWYLVFDTDSLRIHSVIQCQFMHLIPSLWRIS